MGLRTRGDYDVDLGVPEPHVAARALVEVAEDARHIPDADDRVARCAPEMAAGAPVPLS